MGKWKNKKTAVSLILSMAMIFTAIGSPAAYAMAQESGVTEETSEMETSEVLSLDETEKEEQETESANGNAGEQESETETTEPQAVSEPETSPEAQNALETETTPEQETETSEDQTGETETGLTDNSAEDSGETAVPSTRQRSRMLLAVGDNDERKTVELSEFSATVSNWTPVSSVSYGTRIRFHWRYDIIDYTDDVSCSDVSMSFYLGEVKEDNLLQRGTYDFSHFLELYDYITVDGEKWKPSDTPYTIILVWSGNDMTLPATATTTLTVTKAAQSGTPDTPTQSSVSETSITLNEQTGGQNGVEYGYVEGEEGGTPDNWQTSTVFNDLKPGTAYTFYTRYDGNDYYNPSNACASGLTVYTLPSITTTSLEDGGVGVSYSAALEADSSTQVTWSLAAGSSLPDGLTLNSDGTITGTPTTVGITTFTVVASANGVSSEQTLTITVKEAMEFTEFDVTVGSNWTKVSSVSYGTKILFVFRCDSMDDSRPIEDFSDTTISVYLGETIADNLLIRGTYENAYFAEFGKYITVEGEKWKPSDTPYTLTIVYSGNDATLPATATTTLTVTKAAQSGTPDTPTQSSVSETSITLNEQTGGQNGVEYGYVEGTDGGTPDNWQTSTDFSNLKPGTAYTVYARYAGDDYYNPSAACVSGLTVYTLPSITTESLADGIIGASYSAALEADSSTQVTWKLADGSSLPDGLTLNSDGTIAGRPTATGTTTFTVVATANGVSGEQELTLTVNDKTAMRFAGFVISIGEYNYVSSASYGTTIQFDYVIIATDWSEVDYSGSTLSIYLGEVAEENLLVRDNMNWGDLPIKVEGEKWKPSDTPYKLIAVYSGNDTTLPATTTATLTVTKAAQSEIPETPTKSSVSDSSITLNEQTGGQNGVEYGYVEDADGGTPDNWQTSTVFSGLEPNTAYTFYARYAGNDYYEPSAACVSGLTVYTEKKATVISNKSGGEGYPTRFIFGDTIPEPISDYFSITGSDRNYIWHWYGGNQMSGELTGTKYEEPYLAGEYTLVIETEENDTYAGGELRLLITVEAADYIVTIPASADAGGEEISITAGSFKVGTNGRVRVTVSDGAPDGKVTLTLQNSGQANPPTVTSSLLNGKDGTTLTNGSTVALYDAGQNLLEGTTGKLYVTEPEEISIAAGTYTGTVTFRISYEVQNK